MPNPAPAYRNTTCDGCGDEIGEGIDVFFCEGDKLCSGCAEADGYQCECGNFKKSEYDVCYECHESMEDA